AQISAGGTDLLAKLIITKLRHVSLGTLLMCIDGSIVVLAMIAYGEIESGIYAILAIAVTSIVTDKINSGFNKADMFYIFANKNLDKISHAILYDMGRGATCLTGVGMYAGAERKILMVVVKPNEMPRLKAIVHKYDPSVFIILTSAFEIIGEGFEDLNLTSTIHDDDDIEG
ncbi:MAG: YitT family protein, partial [Firmicutes bacterium]|nr:YitT family protein [Bacillota bacterium]